MTPEEADAALEALRDYWARLALDPNYPNNKEARTIVQWLDEIADYIDEHEL